MEALTKYLAMPKKELPENNKGLVIFKGKNIRRIEHNGEWYFSIIDIVEALTDTNNARRYRSDLKRKLSDEEGFSQVYEKIVQLKLPASDGKNYSTDTIKGGEKSEEKGKEKIPKFPIQSKGWGSLFANLLKAFRYDIIKNSPF